MRETYIYLILICIYMCYMKWYNKIGNANLSFYSIYMRILRIYNYDNKSTGGLFDEHHKSNKTK